jgi:lipid II:glycine glycyltransferase (peptidoglycan interpeptide bridge formation enzyme)
MPSPHNERQAVERERVELQEHIATYQHKLEATPAEQKARRERLQWQIRRDQKRIAEIEARLAGG